MRNLDQRLGSILLVLVLSVGITAVGFAKKGGNGGGGKPPQGDPPPPPVNFDPVIATWGQHKDKGTYRDIMMVMDALGETKQVVVDTVSWIHGFARAPVWSPDGTKIAFIGGSLQSNTRGYYVTEMKFDNQGWTGEWHTPALLVALENGAGLASYTMLDWYSDETRNRLVYSAQVSGEEHNDLFVTDFTMDQGQITSKSESAITNTPNLDEFSPTWSNDHSQIAYIEWADGSPSTTRLMIYDLASQASSPLVLPPPLDDAVFAELAWANEHRVLVTTDWYSEAIWCVDINHPDDVNIFNLTATLGPVGDAGVSWIAGDTGVIYGSGDGNLNILEFPLPGGGCPSAAPDPPTVMTDSRFVTAAWWQNSLCGDGNEDPREQCDDGNTNDGDGCSAVCTLEP